MSLDPSLPEANAWRGILATTYEYDWAAATRWFEKAMAFEPVAPRIRHITGYFHLRFVGRANEAVTEHERALREDPLNLIQRVGLAMSLMSAERYDEAAAESRRLRELAPDFPATYTLLTGNVAREPLPTALEFAERLHTRAPWSAGANGLLAGLLRRAGDEQRAAKLYAGIGDPRVYGHGVDLALYRLACGDVDAAFEPMIQLVQQRHPFVMMSSSAARTDRCFDHPRVGPRSRVRSVFGNADSTDHAD